ncbi:INSIG family protein [Streptomyces peucetius]|uniref:INSIG family protein n=1 Tax=Streptomyces peucetius TaxID=1950 RepID=A0ABY6I473_STRPE|nr:INSIG family protein [Streptomyces peucetius]UYQ61641.1 INSIG family protein [Streptomyces peucetius]
MGWTVLYIAFGIVALWLLGEVLLQYKARLRWRVLAFCGFLGVVIGVLLPSVPVIAVGAMAFAVGQTYVTLSFRRGFSTGWALGGSPGVSRRRRSGAAPEANQEPTLEVTDISYDTPEQVPAPPAAAPDVYEPQPMPDDTGQYGVYTPAAYAAHQDEPQHDTPEGQDTGHMPYAAGYDAYDAYADHSPEQPAEQPTYAGQYDYGSTQQYATYSDPYVGGQQYSTYDPYGAGYGDQQQQQQYAAAYGQQDGYSETPPGGVWVPQQRESDQEQPSAYYDSGYNEQQQYRY